MYEEMLQFVVNVHGTALDVEMHSRSRFRVVVTHPSRGEPQPPVLEADLGWWRPGADEDEGLGLYVRESGPPTGDVAEHVLAAVRERTAGWGPPELWLDYNWHCAIAEAMNNIAAVDGYVGDVAPFAISDVAEVIAVADGENDGENWLGVFRLRDGRFAFVTAGCDYTGWD